MNGYDFVASIFSSVVSLGWPTAIAFCFWVFKEDIRKLMPKMRLKHGDSEISFQEIFERGQESAVAQIPAKLVVLPGDEGAVENLSVLTDSELKQRVINIAKQMRQLESEFRNKRYGPKVDEDWNDYIERSDEQRNEQHSRWLDIQPLAKAVMEELVARVGNEGAQNFGSRATIDLGMLAGVSPLNEAASDIERMARKLGGTPAQIHVAKPG